MSPSGPPGYLARPAAGTGHPVLVLHAWWGLNDATKAFCARLAEFGFFAFAPDLYRGEIANDLTEAEALRDELFGQLDRVRADFEEGLAYLEAHTGHGDAGLAVIGFSLGAFFALDLSVSEPERVRSVVVFYGTRPGDYTRSRAAYLGHFAEMDVFEPASEVDALESALRTAARPVTFYRYPGTGHWFFEPDRSEAYHQAAAGLAWERTLAFLRDASPPAAR